jgi:transcription elongation factor GreA
MKLPKRRSEKLKIWDDGPIYFTAEGVTRLRATLERMKRELPSLAAEAERTAAYGDRSDNAEYKDAKANLRKCRFGILGIQEQLKRVAIIPSGPSATGAVRLGSTVVLKTNGKTQTFRILGPRETDPGRGVISHESPLGAALIGRVVGDTVTPNTTIGARVYCILEVR